MSYWDVQAGSGQNRSDAKPATKVDQIAEECFLRKNASENYAGLSTEDWKKAMGVQSISAVGGEGASGQGGSGGQSGSYVRDSTTFTAGVAVGYDAVEPPHYQRGPVVKGHIGEGITMGRGEYAHPVQCIEVMEAMQDPRLATALKYIWRVGFGGKKEPWDSRTQQEVDARDIRSAIWYLERFLSNPSDTVDTAGSPEYNALVRRLEEAERKVEEFRSDA